MAILLPSRTRVELLEAALQRHGVPYRLEGGRGFYAFVYGDPRQALPVLDSLRVGRV